MPRELIIPFLITANYQTSLAIRQLRGELSQLPTELTALRAAAAEVYAMGAMGLFSLGMLAIGAQQLASSLLDAQRMAALAAVASGQFAAASAVANQIIRESSAIIRGTGIDLKSVASAYLEAARAGLTLQESTSLLPHSLRLAITSGGEVAEVFRMTFAIMRNMGIPITEEMARVVSSELSYALDQSLMDIEDVMHAIKYVGPIAGQLRMPIHELFAALMMLHDAGIRASIAGTGLARMLVRLEAPTQQAKRRLAELGIDWHQLRPQGKSLADVLDLLASRADSFTIRLLLGERAERAFYAILQQGTEKLRIYSEELRRVGESSDYLDKKFQALTKTPGFRFQIALQDLRNSLTILVEPFVRLQLTLLEMLSGLVKTISDSPFLRIAAKMAIGFGGLAGTIMLVVSSLSWLAGRFLELNTIGTHFLMVLDRINAALRSLTIQALTTPIKGLGAGLKALIFGGGIESLATLVSERLRVSELASAISQPLVFFRRARRIHPLLQPLPEYFGLTYGSIRQAAQELGIPLEKFLLAGMTYGGLRATIPQLTPPDISKTLILNYLNLMAETVMASGEALLKSIAKPGAPIFTRVPPSLTPSNLWKKISDVITDIRAKTFSEWLTKVYNRIYDAIVRQDLVLTAADIKALGFDESIISKRAVAGLFAEGLREMVESRSQALKQLIARELMQLPELQQLSKVSRQASKALTDFFENAFVDVPLMEIERSLKTFFRDFQSSLDLNTKAQPLLAEYQRKVQAALREANVPSFLRSVLLGAAILPVDALEEASYMAIAATTGLHARRLPGNAKQFESLIKGLTAEFASFFQGVSDVVSAASWFGLAFGASIDRLSESQLQLIRSLIAARSRRIESLKKLRFLGLANANQIAELSQAQAELGVLLGMTVAESLRKVQSRVLSGLTEMDLNARRIRQFYNFVSDFQKESFRELRNALLTLGFDMPELIGRLLREGAPFYRTVRQSLSKLPQADLLQQQWFQFMSTVMRANRAIQQAFPQATAKELTSLFTQFGLSERQAAEIIEMLQAGLLLHLAEQAALGKTLSQAVTESKGIRLTVFGQLLGSMKAIIATTKAVVSNIGELMNLFWSTALNLFASIALYSSGLVRSIPTGLARLRRSLHRAMVVLAIRFPRETILVTELLGKIINLVGSGIWSLVSGLTVGRLAPMQFTVWWQSVLSYFAQWVSVFRKLFDQLNRGVYTIFNIPRRIPRSVRIAAQTTFVLQQLFGTLVGFVGSWLTAMVDAAFLRMRQLRSVFAMRNLRVALSEFLVQFTRTLGSVVGGPIQVELLAGIASRVVQPIRSWLSSLLVTTVKPIFSQLSLLPQFLLGQDIIRAVRPTSVFGVLAKGLGIGTIVGTILSFILDMIPWEDIGRAFNWSVKTQVYLQNAGRGIRAAISALLVSLGYLLKIVTYDLVAGLIDIFTGGKGVIERARESFRSLKDVISNMYTSFVNEVNAQIQLAWAETEIGLVELANSLKSFRRNLTAGLDALFKQEQSLRKVLLEGWSIIVGTAPGAQIAPAGFEQSWKEIGRMSIVFSDAYGNLTEFFSRLHQISQRREVFAGIATQMTQSVDNLKKRLEELKALGPEVWKGVGTTVPEQLQDALENLRVAFSGYGPGQIGGLFRQFQKLRNQILQLPPAQREALADTLSYIDSILARESKINSLIDKVALDPAKYRQQLMQELSQLAGLLSADQLRANIFDPIREQLENLQEQAGETVRTLRQLQDPFVRRQLALDIAKQQFEVLTASQRQLYEVSSAWSEFVGELRGLASSDFVSAALALGAAWDAVMDALSKPQPHSLEHALMMLRESFAVVGEKSEETLVKVLELDKLLRQYNFMALSPEAAMETRRRIAELGKEVLEAFRKIRDGLLQQIEELKNLADDYAETFNYFVSPRLIDTAIALERQYLSLVNIEAQRRAQMMKTLGYSDQQISESLQLFYARAFSKLNLLRLPTLEQIQRSFAEMAEMAESSEDHSTAFAQRQAAATIALQRYYRFVELANRVLLRVGERTQAFYDYMSKARAALKEAMELSLDVKVAFTGLQSIWSEVSGIFSNIGDSFEGLFEKVSMFGTVFSIGMMRIRYLLNQISRFAVGGVGAFVNRMRLWQQVKEIWKTLFPQPDEIADALKNFADMLERFVEQGYVPSFLGLSIPQVRGAFQQVLTWLRDYYYQQFQAISQLLSQVPQWTRVWLELFNAQMKVAQSLAEIEDRMRRLRVEFLSMELIAVPERVGQFLVTQGPALLSFMRTGPLSGRSTIQFNINIYAQDVQAGVQQALFEAQRRLMGFNLQPIF